ncbi:MULTISPECIES: hypothetical protein [unclassified Desulfovibrio]|uniref:hypothetical protein n=1 Tax=unclassified Desulfovibrio TaxID=2593640 RepID=UPI0013EB43E8|nr:MULTISPECIES: hypothetical protein [unclassified Desulfovibrio]
MADSDNSKKPLPYLWGQALAFFDAATPDGLSPFAMNNAVERPLTSLPSLTVKARSKDQGLQKRLAEHMAGLGGLPKQLSLEEQGQVYLGYYSLRSSLPPSPSRNGARKKIDWEDVDWGKTDAEIAAILNVSRTAVMNQRKKREA